MTATLWHLFDNKLYGFNEIVLPSNADTQKMANALKARGYTPDRTIIYPDPAGQARSTKGQPDHTILRNAGFEIKARSAQPYEPTIDFLSPQSQNQDNRSRQNL